tara:strand:+ start:209 stop:1375 length:1167 start_codon:yes stop_codon:yes gene_type:complete
MVTPSATNGVGSYRSHVLRRQYIREAYPHFIENNAMDLWYGDKVLYGRVDHYGEAIVLKKEFLATFPSAPTHRALNFVVDAYEEFREFIASGFNRGIFTSDTRILKTMTVHRSYDDPAQGVKDILLAQEDSFHSIYIPEFNKDREIRDIKDYISVFQGFASRSAPQVPITLSSFMRSTFASPMTSGLMLEIFPGSHSKDAQKLKVFVRDPNFRLYQQAARRFGFKIDYNAPWRLIADVTTKEMKKYMSVYSIGTYRDLFNLYYDKPNLIDPLILKEFVFSSYNNFVEFNPYTVLPDSPKTVFEFKNYEKTARCIVRRREIARRSFENIFDELYWLKFYFNIKSVELKISWTQTQRSKRLLQMERIYKELDINKAMVYIEDQLRQYSEL